MPTEKNASSGDQLTALAEGVIRDVRKLITEHVDLLRAEIQQDVRRTGTAAASLSAGAGLAALGGVMGTLMLVHLLHRATRLPLWTCYGLVGGTLGAGGAALLYTGARAVAELGRVAPETTRAVREDITWAKEQALPARG
jgi:hypothetical protein